MSKVGIAFVDNKLVASLDSNEDGQNSISLKLSVGEAIVEGMAALKKGEEKVVSLDVKAVNMIFKDNKLVLVVDTDKDGEAVLELEVDMSESLEEVTGLMLK